MDIPLLDLNVRMPRACACCLAEPTERVASSMGKYHYRGAFSYSTSMTLDVPYCDECARHVRAHAAPLRPPPSTIFLFVFLVLMVGSFVLAFLLAGAGPPQLLTEADYRAAEAAKNRMRRPSSRRTRRAP